MAQTKYVKDSIKAVTGLVPARASDTLVIKLRDLIVKEKAWVWTSAISRKVLLKALFPGKDSKGKKDLDGNYLKLTKDLKKAESAYDKANAGTKASLQARCDIVATQAQLAVLSKRGRAAVSRLKGLLLKQNVYFLTQKTYESEDGSWDVLHCVALDKASLEFAVEKHMQSHAKQARLLEVVQAAIASI